MLGHKAREFRQHQSISLEDLVPNDNFYRQVEQTLDLRFVRELVSEDREGIPITADREKNNPLISGLLI